ncbi:hypothetical protein BG95_08990 [Thermosipho sp. 1063]|uniref:hypothetical protein n=1 Tax=unclassified Thermosipho (in: thermotogales) TaxID=2676525 RepID=UPI0009492E07|nr:MULTISPECIES: hypothetical protein [unclassified Thermosipho (in: thermotogales)]ANQ54694.1 hypothetical protein Y592_09095 [Thermosipho sp. 1070]APT73083.1 hypothetical protein BG95_08990 [Thermosipho sp. 1063]OOC42401.1 hypothetical protein XO08_09035 [Thermosipho sp. 1074]
MTNSDIMEINVLIKSLPKKDFMEIVEESFKQALKSTINHKIVSFKYFLKDITKVSFLTTKFVFRLLTGKISFSDVILNSKKFVYKKYNNFKKLSLKKKKEKIANLTIYFITALLVGGGIDFEGGIPDLDLKTGIKNHRNIITHTIIGLFLLEFMARFLFKLVQKTTWNKENMVLRTIYEISLKEEEFINGAWLGLSFHLLKDAGLFQKTIKPYSGIRGHTMGFHKSLFLGNSILAAIFSRKNEKI